jgi:hypothetical protein
MLLGILGVAFGVTAAALGLLNYVLNGIGSPANPYAPRLGFGIATFAFALLIGVGAALLRARPDLGSLLMIADSVGGTLALSAFNAGPTVVALRWLTLLLLAAGVAAGYSLGGVLAALVFAVPFLIAAVLVLTGAGESQPSQQV